MQARMIEKMCWNNHPWTPPDPDCLDSPIQLTTGYPDSKYHPYRLNFIWPSPQWPLTSAYPLFLQPLLKLPGFLTSSLITWWYKWEGKYLTASLLCPCLWSLVVLWWIHTKMAVGLECFSWRQIICKLVYSIVPVLVLVQIFQHYQGLVIMG